MHTYRKGKDTGKCEQCLLASSHSIAAEDHTEKRTGNHQGDPEVTEKLGRKRGAGHQQREENKTENTTVVSNIGINSGRSICFIKKVTLIL